MFSKRSSRAEGADSLARSKARLKGALGLLVAVVVVKAGSDAMHRYAFALNQTESLPHWALLTDQRDRSPKRGQLVAFVPPPNPYYPRGMVFGKIVAGVPGDLVERRGHSFFVAGRYVGEAKIRTRDGRIVEAGPVGRLPAGRYFLYTPHPDSFDSRYALIGWVPQSQILGVARPIL